MPTRTDARTRSSTRKSATAADTPERAARGTASSVHTSARTRKSAPARVRRRDHTCEQCASGYATLRTLVLHIASAHLPTSPRAPGYAQAWVALDRAVHDVLGWA